MPSTAWKLKTQHEKWYAGEVISVGIGQGAVTATPLQLARALGGIASGGVLRRPHVIFDNEIPADQLQAIRENFPGSGEKTIPLTTENWQIITDAMAATTTTGTAAAVHMDGIDFAGKTGTARSLIIAPARPAWAREKSAPTPGSSAWPRAATPTSSSPYWSSTADGVPQPSAPLAARVIDVFVEKQRKRENNVRIADVPKPATPPAPATTSPSGTKPAAE